MKKNIRKLNQNKGFTLLETLVAIFILTLSLTGPVYIASVAFHNTIDSRDNISAQYIAEEVIEVIRNKRDGYILNHNDN
ncbi:type II secretion system protein, partial [Arenimonas sp.]|nr:type II secretion system protein [Candidatus Parcubacteria bacterium]